MVLKITTPSFYVLFKTVPWILKDASPFNVCSFRSPAATAEKISILTCVLWKFWRSEKPKAKYAQKWMKTREAKMCIVACECDPASQVPCPSFSPKCPSGQVFQGSPSGHSNPKHSLLVGSPVNYPAHLVSRRGDIQAGIASQDLSRTCPAHPMILSPHFFPLPDLTLQGCV